jgi:hypothetical protein
VSRLTNSLDQIVEDFRTRPSTALLAIGAGSAAAIRKEH